MKSLRTLIVIGLGLAAGSIAGTASAQDDYAEEHAAERANGEISPGTRAPTRSGMLTTLERGAPGAIQAVLEYGERVECHQCVPVLERYLLEHRDPLVREMAAWWLRRRSFAIGAIMNRMKVVLANDADPVRRSRAAEAIGEFLDPNAVNPLTVAASSDSSGVVRASAVRALGRLNHPGGQLAVAAALEDGDTEVRRAALDAIPRINFFREHEALLVALGDEDAQVRMRAARLVGQLGVNAAVAALGGMALGDESRDVRQSAAWALGRLGGAEARAALNEALAGESDSLVRDALRVALAM